MKKLLLSLISLGVLYFLVGFIAVKIGWFSSDIYNSYSTIVGGVATLCGLLTFALPKLTPKDIETLEVESLQRVTKVAEELSVKRNELNLTATEISKLEQQKQEMEFLVKKTSYVLFLKDQIERNESRVTELLNENKELSRLLDVIKTNHVKLIALDEEIHSSEHVELLLDIMSRAERDKDAVRFAGKEINNPFLKSYIRIIREVVKF